MACWRTLERNGDWAIKVLFNMNTACLHGKIYLKLRYLLLFLFLIISTVAFIHYFYLTTKVPPEPQTYLRMLMIRKAILTYANSHNSLPIDLSELQSATCGKSLLVVDSWGRNIIYRIDGNIVILKSYGKEGIDRNIEIQGIFETKSINGMWISPDCDDWKVRPRTMLKR